MNMKELELDVGWNGRRAKDDECWSIFSKEGWTKGWTKVEELKMLQGIWRSPSPPCLRSCISSCTQGEVIATTNGWSGCYIEAFIETKHTATMEIPL